MMTSLPQRPAVAVDRAHAAAAAAAAAAVVVAAPRDAAAVAAVAAAVVAACCLLWVVWVGEGGFGVVRLLGGR
jgi:hypothetical protein